MSNGQQESCEPGCLEHSEHVYILCYGRPVLVRDRDYLRDDPSMDYPITHYVGWTGQQPPVKRVRDHGAKSARYIARTFPGSMRDQERIKLFESCPECGKSLWYYAESPSYSESYRAKIETRFYGRGKVMDMGIQVIP